MMFSASEVFACTCAEQTVEDAFEQDAVIFSGQVISVTNGSRYKKVKIRVLNTWKGRLPKTVTVTTPAADSMCGFSFVAGRKYLIYSDSEKPSNISVNLCSRTDSLAGAKEDIAVLNNLKSKPAPK